MKKLLNIFLTLLIVIGLSKAFAIDRIYIGNIDGTLTTAPFIVSLLSTETEKGVYTSSEGSIYGTTIAATKTKYSTNGITFTTTTTDTPSFTHAIAKTGSRILTIKTSVSPNVVYYSDDNGLTWSTTSIIGSIAATILNDQKNNLICYQQTCFYGGMITTSVTAIFKSSDNGSTWSNISFAGVAGPVFLAYYDGTNVITVKDYDAGSITPTAIITSTDNGSTWNSYSPSTPFVDVFHATRKGTTYYAIGDRQDTGVCESFSSTDLINWSYTPSNLTDQECVTGIAYAGYNNYNPNTIYLGISNTLNSTIDIFTTTDNINFLLFQQIAVVPGTTIGNFITMNNEIYFGTSDSNNYYKIGGSRGISIPIVNSGFDDVTLLDGGATFGIQWWSGTGTFGTKNPTSDLFYIEPTGNVAWLISGYIYQVLPYNLVAGNVYTLTVDVGYQTLASCVTCTFFGYTIELLAGNTSLASYTGVGIQGLWHSAVLNYTATTSEGPLQIRLTTEGKRTHFNNVILTYR